MTEKILVKLFEHNNWANLRIIQACSALSDEQLDAAPISVTKGCIRETLTHLVSSQHNYLALLTLPLEERTRIAPAFSELREAVLRSGEALLALARDESGFYAPTRLRTRDEYIVKPWVVMLQVINHASEHREQISSMLTSLGITPPEMNGWAYGEATNALVPISA
jgi:uncharacterized damage-inducible protein DinB